MVVDEYLEAAGLDDGVLEVLPGTVRHIHIHHEEDVGLLDGLAGCGEVLLGDDDVVGPLHPVEEVRERVRRDDRHLVTVVFEVVVQGQRGAHRVPVRVEMEDNGNALGLPQRVFEELDFLFFQVSVF